MSTTGDVLSLYGSHQCFCALQEERSDQSGSDPGKNQNVTEQKSSPCRGQEVTHLSALF